jgi:SAM-dependent methyltransferase
MNDVVSDTPAKPALLDAILQRAEAHIVRENWPAAADFLKLATQVRPAESRLHGALGGLLFRLQAYQEAADSFATALRLAPHSAEWQAQLALAEAHLGQAPATTPTSAQATEPTSPMTTTQAIPGAHPPASTPGASQTMDAAGIPNDADRIHAMGHRDFVGGNGPYWEALGQLQYDYLLAAGLKPHHVFLDIACGSLRGGRHFIRYLEPGRYLGVDKEIDLLILGVAAELGVAEFKAKRPQFIVTDTFDFRRITACPDFALAQSLFTHLTAADIYRCLASLRTIAGAQTVFYATFFETAPGAPAGNPRHSDSLGYFHYTQDFLRVLADTAGWQMHYLGDWSHPRNQKLLKFTPAS